MEFDQLKRREFITLLGGAAAGWPSCTMAQPTARLYQVGVIVPPVPAGQFAPVFAELSKLGFTEGQNLKVDGRGWNANNENLPRIAKELVAAGMDAIFCVGDAAIRAAQAATKTIPIVANTDDMLGAGLVQSLARPGGNTTGFSILADELDGKRQEILIELLPKARRIGVLNDAQRSDNPGRVDSLRSAARSRGVELMFYPVERSEDVAPAVNAAHSAGVSALNVLASPLLHGSRATIIQETMTLYLPAIYQWSETAREGGLVAYGPSVSELYSQQARQLAEVLRGKKPSDLPVEQPTKFELVLNLKTAKALGVMIPESFLLRTDEVIE
jgi:putative tryptophan/tyrosine transport system substrate-binding protein